MFLFVLGLEPKSAPLVFAARNAGV